MVSPIKLSLHHACLDDVVDAITQFNNSPKMVVITSSDIIALIRSFTTLFEQLRGCSVNKEWKRMIDAHPMLLHVLDFGNPITFLRVPFEPIIKLAGSRIRRLKLCNLYPLPFYNIQDLLLSAVTNLQYLEIVGHISPEKFRLVLDVFVQSKVRRITIRMATCSCWISFWTNNQRTPKIKVETGVDCHFSNQACDNCGTKDLWCRRCPVCHELHCESCCGRWRWGNKLVDQFILNASPCSCSLCSEAPSWHCKTHCTACLVFF